MKSNCKSVKNHARATAFPTKNGDAERISKGTLEKFHQKNIKFTTWKPNLIFFKIKIPEK